MMMMQARDSSGRRVSLLNDDPVVGHHPQRLSYRTASQVVSQPYHRSGSLDSLGNTPELMRSDSYDSNTSSDPLSPQTPYDYHARTSRAYPAYPTYDEYEAKRPSFADSSRSNSYEDDAASSVASPLAGPADARPGKRYPCRYRDSHGCDKTFTTSGHASRHSKIHTAEKAVQCTFAGCQKKFTRADNMKQHLETHYKDKSRSSGSSSSSSRSSSGRPGASASSHSSSASSSARRTSSSSSAGRTSSSTSSRSRHEQAWDADPYSNHHLASPDAGVWDMRGLNLPLLTRPSAARTPSSGLDALAMAVACQEGS